MLTSIGPKKTKEKSENIPPILDIIYTKQRGIKDRKNQYKIGKRPQKSI